MSGVLSPSLPLKRNLGKNSEDIFDIAQKLDEKGVRVRVGKHRLFVMIDAGDIIPVLV